MKTFISAALFTLFVFAANVSFAQFNQASYVKGVKSYVQIDWSLNKKDVSHFIIERSVDGKNFKTCAIVFTSEDPAFTDYKFRDRELTTGSVVVYYRIGTVTNKKEVSYFPIQKVALNSIAENLAMNGNMSNI